ADILSVLAMTYSDTQPCGTLCYCLLSVSLQPAGSPPTDPGTCRHEYNHLLAAELGDDTHSIIGTIEDLCTLAKECTVFFIGHNTEPDVVNLLEELEIVDEIAQLVDDNMYNRILWISCVNLSPPPDNISCLWTAHKIYVQLCKFPEALTLMIWLRDPELIREDFNAPRNSYV
ncbi:hypothetical protein DFH08DRAFT_717555, partial [Mycena albidolilacea]